MKNEAYRFLIDNSLSQNFVFSKYVKTLIELNYIELNYAKNTQTLLCLLKTSYEEICITCWKNRGD